MLLRHKIPSKEISAILPDPQKNYFSSKKKETEELRKTFFLLKGIVCPNNLQCLGPVLR